MPPLIESNVAKRKLVPDENGGWYWLKLTGKDWEPVLVDSAKRGWPATVNLCTHACDVEEVQGEWGFQILPPSSE